jgi:hypothetical protein
MPPVQEGGSSDRGRACKASSVGRDSMGNGEGVIGERLWPHGSRPVMNPVGVCVPPPHAFLSSHAIAEPSQTLRLSC